MYGYDSDEDDDYSPFGMTDTCKVLLPKPKTRAEIREEKEGAGLLDLFRKVGTKAMSKLAEEGTKTTLKKLAIKGATKAADVAAEGLGELAAKKLVEVASNKILTKKKNDKEVVTTFSDNKPKPDGGKGVRAILAEVDEAETKAEKKASKTVKAISPDKFDKIVRPDNTDRKKLTKEEVLSILKEYV